MSNKQVCVSGDVEIKTPIVRNKARLIENVVDDGARFLKRLLPLVAMAFLGYYYGKANLEPVTVTCDVQQEYVVAPVILPKTGGK